MERLDLLVRVLLAASPAVYLAAFMALLLRRGRAGGALLGAGWALNVSLFAAHWRASGEPPLGNLYHVLIALSACFPPLGLAPAVRADQGRLRAFFALAAALPLLGAACMGPDLLWHRPPALQSAWFLPHVAGYLLAYALAFLAFLMVLVSACGARWLAPGRADELDAAGHRLLRLAFPFLTFGLIAGAAWAERAWGAYWSWDAKETWALITWMLYALYFHCRAAPALRRRAQAVHILAFLALLCTFVLVSLLPRLGSVLHRCG